MGIFAFSRIALTISVAASLLAGCGGSPPPIGVLGASNESRDSLPYHKTFNYTGRKQSFVVPPGVRWMTVVARGARGGGYLGGRGGRVFAEFPVVPGERLFVFVGGKGTGASGGFNGGGEGVSSSSGLSDGGGGASDIREGGSRLRDRILVVGGGGGQGDFFDHHDYGNGGKGGGSTAGNGSNGYAPPSGSGTAAGGGGGGTQYSGGIGGQGGSGGYGYGIAGTGGALGKGGAGGEGTGSDSGGGGGGGYYGGGGGGGGGWDYGGYSGGGGGGGGGSSYIEPSARKYVSWQGWKNATGNGLVVFSWQ